jgi:hypothetical protein
MKLLARLLMLLLCIPALTFAQSKIQLTGGAWQTGGGTPFANGRLTLQLSQSCTVTGVSQIVNTPIMVSLDSNGNVPSSLSVWGNDVCSPSGTYYSMWVEVPGATVSGWNRIWGINYTQFTGSGPINLNTLVLTGANNLMYGYIASTNQANSRTSAQSFLSINTSTIFADVLTPSAGLCSVSGSDASAKIQCAINLLPTVGGVINAINLSDSGSGGSTSIDPGTKAVTILLGPHTYYVKQITLRSEFNLFGTGLTNPSGFQGTVIQQASPSLAPIILPTSGSAANTVVQGARLSNFSLVAAAGSKSDGISLIAAGCGVGCSGGGLWYSEFDNIQIGNFGRNELRIDNTQCDKCSNQFDSFRDIWAFRAINSPPVLMITGSYSGQMTFDACEFDVNFGQTDTNANLVNVSIENTPGVGSNNWAPYSIKFHNTTIQFAKATGGVGLYIKGGRDITCDNCHFEGDNTIVSVVQGAWGTVVMNSYIDGFSGAGGLIKIDAHSSLSFHDNSEATNPPSGGFLVSGSVPTFLDWYDNYNSVGGATYSPLPNPGMTIAQLPPVAYAVGGRPGGYVVTDSTTIATEGQTCTHAASGAVTAIAISNGTVWKCF